jgi:branched-subunit amino acid ABC-type transport system permease component
LTELLSLVVAGAVAGGLYAIMASGLVLTYQASGVFNLGHGAVAFVSALTYYVLNQPREAGGVGLPIALAGLIAIGVVAPLIGWLLDVALFRKLASAPEAARLVGGIGVLIALPAASLLLIDLINGVFGTDLPNAAGQSGISPPGLGPVPAKSFSLTTGVAVSSDQLAVVAAAAFSATGLWYLLRRTRLGLETRAGVDRPVLARLRGIDTDRSSRIVWSLSSALAGLAGVLIAPIFDLSALTFHMIVFTSFTAAVAARLRSVPIAFGAGIALGVIQNLAVDYAPEFLTDVSGFRSSIPFMLLFILLFFVQGRGRAAGTVAEEAPVPDPRADLPPWRPPAAVGDRALRWSSRTASSWPTPTGRASCSTAGLVLGLVFLSFVVVTGLGGMINLAQATFVTVGGFTAGWLVNHQWPSTDPDPHDQRPPDVLDGGADRRIVVTTLVGSASWRCRRCAWVGWRWRWPPWPWRSSVTAWSSSSRGSATAPAVGRSPGPRTAPSTFADANNPHGGARSCWWRSSSGLVGQPPAVGHRSGRAGLPLLPGGRGHRGHRPGAHQAHPLRVCPPPSPGSQGRCSPWSTVR